MNRWLDCIQIWFGCFLGISDDLINFWINPLKTKWLPQPFKKMHMVVVGCIFFSLLARLLILIKKGGLLQLKFGVVGVGVGVSVGVGVGVNIYLWAR